MFTFIEAERGCSLLFRFEIVLEPDGGLLRMSLRGGGDGVRHGGACPTAERRIIVTEDQHVGERFTREYRGRVGVILLRHRIQSAHAANESLARLFDDPTYADTPFERRLVIVDGTKLRIRE